MHLCINVFNIFFRQIFSEYLILKLLIRDGVSDHNIFLSIAIYNLMFLNCVIIF